MMMTTMTDAWVAGRTSPAYMGVGLVLGFGSLVLWGVFERFVCHVTVLNDYESFEILYLALHLITDELQEEDSG